MYNENVAADRMIAVILMMMMIFIMMLMMLSSYIIPSFISAISFCMSNVIIINIFITADRTWCVSTASKLMVLLDDLYKTGKKIEIEITERTKNEIICKHENEYERNANENYNSNNFTINKDDMRLGVEVASTIKMFVFKLPYMQTSFSFGKAHLSDLMHEDDSNMYGINDDKIRYYNNGKISVRPLLMRVLRPSPPTPAQPPSSSYPSYPSKYSTQQTDKYSTHTNQTIDENDVIKIICAQTLWLLVFNSSSMIKKKLNVKHESNENMTLNLLESYHEKKEGSNATVLSKKNILKGLVDFVHTCR